MIGGDDDGTTRTTLLSTLASALTAYTRNVVYMKLGAQNVYKYIDDRRRRVVLTWFEKRRRDDEENRKMIASRVSFLSFKCSPDSLYFNGASDGECQNFIAKQKKNYKKGVAFFRFYRSFCRLLDKRFCISILLFILFRSIFPVEWDEAK